MVYVNGSDLLLMSDMKIIGLHPRHLEVFLQLIPKWLNGDRLKSMLFIINSDAHHRLFMVILRNYVHSLNF
jgi:hypothetical protein